METNQGNGLHLVIRHRVEEGFDLLSGGDLGRFSAEGHGRIGQRVVLRSPSSHVREEVLPDIDPREGLLRWQQVVGLQPRGKAGRGGGLPKKGPAKFTMERKGREKLERGNGSRAEEREKL